MPISKDTPGLASNGKARWPRGRLASSLLLSLAACGQPVEGEPSALIAKDPVSTCTATCADPMPPPPPPPAVDILFVVDDSCSMADEQATLAANFPVLLDHVQAAGLDYHIGVTTTDLDARAGRLVGATKFITPSTPDPATVFAQNVMVGTDGAPFEQGLHASYLALSPPLESGDNAGFLRADASLVLVFLSDEDDQSTEPQAFYSAFFGGLKAAPHTVTVNAIAGPSAQNTACWADPAQRYDSVVQSFGGVIVSVCAADWSPALTSF